MSSHVSIISHVSCNHSGGYMKGARKKDSSVKTSKFLRPVVIHETKAEHDRQVQRMKDLVKSGILGSDLLRKTKIKGLF